MTITITAALILSLAAAYWLLRPSGDHKHKIPPTQRTTGSRSPYGATSIKFKACACSAVKAVADTRFLSSENVPKLPLADCTAASCTCRYVRHQDRRSSLEDRRALYSLRTDLYTAGSDTERRVKNGRRDSDRSSGSVKDLTYAEFEWTS